MAGSDLPAEFQVQVTQGFRLFGPERDALRGENGRPPNSACSASRLTPLQVRRRLAKSLCFANLARKNVWSLNCLAH